MWKDKMKVTNKDLLELENNLCNLIQKYNLGKDFNDLNSLLFFN